MRRWRLAAGGCTLALGLFTASSGLAQQVVHDPTAYAQMLREAKTALDQLNALRAQVEQGAALLGSLNDISNVNAIAEQLAGIAVRNPLPDMAALASVSSSGDLTELGSIGARAADVREAHRIYAAPDGDVGPAEAWYRASLERSGARAARDYAVGEALGKAANSRLEGLETLRSALDTAPSARAVLDLNARLVAEQALISNEQTRLQGLQLMRDSEAALEAQQARERAAVAHAARLRLYESAFR